MNENLKSHILKGIVATILLTIILVISKPPKSGKYRTTVWLPAENIFRSGSPDFYDLEFNATENVDMTKFQAETGEQKTHIALTGRNVVYARVNNGTLLTATYTIPKYEPFGQRSLGRPVHQGAGVIEWQTEKDWASAITCYLFASSLFGIMMSMFLSNKTL